MILGDVIKEITTLNEDLFICMKKPWGKDAEVILVMPTEELAVPQNIKDEGYYYFIEIGLAKDILTSLADKHLVLDSQVDLILYYGEFDAYPEWTDNL
jgi:hypothetical protein